MTLQKPIQRALISVFYKDGLVPIVEKLHANHVEILSTGGTLSFIQEMGIPVTAVEEVTKFPEILGGRVKTLHPAIFGGILNRRDFAPDQAHMAEHQLGPIDLVIVDLYPFDQTVASGATHSDIIEKIDIGGVSLIRAAAKNYNDVLIVPSVKQYSELLEILNNQGATSSLAQRKAFAAEAFHVSSHYDTMIHQYFMNGKSANLKISEAKQSPLRYGENPHQKGVFFGDLEALFTKLHGKELSYNNLLDVDAAVRLMLEFKQDGPTFAILKHNNACGLATRPTLKAAYQAALAADPVSAFGGILISNQEVELDTAILINDLFCEVLIAPAYSKEAVELLQSKKNRIILVQNDIELPTILVRSALNGYLVQDADLATEGQDQIAQVVNTLQRVVPDIPPGLNWIIRVDGHTDDVPLSGTGDFHDNWELSQARALSVVRYMTDVLGFPPDRVAAAGFGQYQPVAAGETAEARALNRRIELKLTER